jgi:Adenylate cyclase, family 3 (some proteins contain HAMP domain)
MEPRIQYAKTSDGVNIAYAVFGEGPPIVFPSNIWGNVHSYMTGSTAVRNYDGLVALGWSVISYDGRGSGNSDRGITDFSLEMRLRDLEAVIEKAAPERFVLCGSLQGSLAAIAYAVQQPSRVSHLILSNAFAKAEEYYALIPAMRLSQATLDMAEGDMAEGDWEFHLQTLAHAIGGYSNPDHAQVLLRMFRTGMTRADYVAYRRAASQIDVTHMLGGISIPTLVVTDNSFESVAAFPPLSRRLAAAIPNARYVESNGLPETTDDFLREGGLVPFPLRGLPTKRPSEASDLRTVLFTDLVGHTEMMSRLGDERGRDVLREHERITREVLKANGGTEVKTMGDGFMASFGSVTKAVECAIALQKGFAEWNAGGPEPLHVRVGLNAGEPIQEEGDLFGATVILASRIAARAEAGEILVANAVRELSSGKGFLFADRGDFAAKGFEEPVRVYEVNWRDET